VFVIHLFMGCP